MSGMNNIKTRNMIITALLTALGIMIPIVFTFLRVVLPPAFTATLGAHVPVMTAMFISPLSAIFVAIGTTVGFLFTGLPPVVTARAATHIIYAVVGAYMVRKRANIIIIGAVTMLIHGIFEALVVIPFLAADENLIYSAFYVTGLGTIIHHIIDFVIALGVVSALRTAKLI